MAETWEKILHESDYDKGRRVILTPAGAIVPASGGAEQKQTDGTNFSYYTLNFDKDADESAYWQLIVPDDYDGGTLLFSIWYKDTATTGNVIFDVYALGREEGEVFDASLGSAHSVTDTTPATAGNIGVCAPSAFSPGWTAGDLVIIKLTRDANNASDTLDCDCSVIMVVVEY